MMPISPPVAARLRRRLEALYASRGAECFAQVQQLLASYAPRLPRPEPRRWDQRDVVLITYGDQVTAPGEHPLATLRRFLGGRQLDEVISTVHLLPFFPYSSDDGFSVIDFRQVDPQLGDWQDVEALGRRFALMFDFVLNHISARSQWFQGFLEGREPYTRYFIEADPDRDLSPVTRPRSLPLLTRVETSRGPRHVWTTFSPDQIDLNYAEPAVLLEMTDVLLGYVARGARIIRMDAVAYLWKTPGTSCIHLPETHEVVRYFRDVVEAVAPHVLLLTETNVPHRENVSYFGDGDEAHMVYQFSLPPLLLDAFASGDAGPLMTWLANLEPPPAGTTYFNFTASHDGVGVRPLEGLVPPERLARLIEAVRQRGGQVSTRRNPDGSDSPYELNVTYFDALGGPGLDAAAHARRFLASQAIMLALRGMPAVYFHSLVGTPNDVAGAQQSGQPRRINRRRFALDELNAMISDDTAQTLVFEGYRRLLATRIAQRAFHPDAPQQVYDPGDPALVAFYRGDAAVGQRILVAANVSDAPRRVPLPPGTAFGQDLLADPRRAPAQPLELEPYQVAWLELQR